MAGGHDTILQQRRADALGENSKGNKVLIAWTFDRVGGRHRSGALILLKLKFIANFFNKIQA
ncbi:hypothetical protein JOS77_02865 [Chromobacterium haemolyticum]|nr:hypothetical protein JOS77_02865 [Chromobacterium haemolyticum]